MNDVSGGWPVIGYFLTDDVLLNRLTWVKYTNLEDDATGEDIRRRFDGC